MRPGAISEALPSSPPSNPTIDSVVAKAELHASIPMSSIGTCRAIARAGWPGNHKAIIAKELVVGDRRRRPGSRLDVQPPLVVGLPRSVVAPANLYRRS